MAGPTHPDLIGGGRALRSFTMGTERVSSGRTLTRDEIVRMPHQNRNALIEKGYIMTWPKDVVAGVVAPAAAAAPAGSKRHVLPLGFGKWCVVEGVLLNEKPLTRDEAHALAGLPPPEAEKKAG